MVTVAISQARLGSFSPVFGPQYVSVKFKRLIISVLEMPQKLRIYAERAVGCKILQAQRLKTNK